MSLSVTASAGPSLSDTTPRHIVLLHGLGDNAAKMRALRRYFAGRGYHVHAMKLSGNWGQIGIEGQAEEVRDYVAAHIPADERFDLIGFSMGGIVSRYYVQRLGGLDRVRRLVTVSSPHRGTLMAYILPTKAVRQMRPGSAFLRDLASDVSVLQQVGFTSFWTPFDLIVIPANSSIVPGARCQRLLCAAHPLMVFEPRCIRAIASSLEDSLAD